MGFSLALSSCAMVCKTWSSSITNPEGVFSFLFRRAFLGEKPLYQSWASVFSSFPVLLDILCKHLSAIPRSYLGNLVHKTPWFRDLCQNKIQMQPEALTLKIEQEVFDWAISFGFKEIVHTQLTYLPGNNTQRQLSLFSSLLSSFPLLFSFSFHFSLLSLFIFSSFSFHFLSSSPLRFSKKEEQKERMI